MPHTDRNLMTQTFSEADLSPEDYSFEQFREVLKMREGQVTGLAMENELLSEELAERTLEEDYTSLSLSLDDRGWAPMSGLGNPYIGPTARELVMLARTLRTLFAGNPLVKRGCQVRHTYIWGDGVNFGNEGENPRVKHNGITEQTDNARLVFSPTAYGEAEYQLATEGNVFFLASKKSRRVIRIPLNQITEYISSPDTGLVDDIRYYKRIWSVTVITSQGNVEPQTQEMWYPACSYSGPLPSSIQGVPVSRTAAIEKVSANKQAGWILGVPDLLAVHYWARAYKEFLESNWALTKALAKYAWKITSKTQGGQARVSAKLATQVASPPLPVGSPGQVGLTAPLMDTMDLQAVSKAGANANFDAGRPLASMVAAGLEISTDTLLADKSSPAEADLDDATVDMVTSRQNLWAAAFINVLTYMGVSKPTVKFPPVQSTPLWRLVQGIVTAASTGVLFPIEVRQMVLTALRDLQIEEKDGVPPAGLWQKYIAPPAAPSAHPGTTPQGTPDPSGQGGSGTESPAGPQADGTNDARNTGGKTT